jgi:hypothetical protein
MCSRHRRCCAMPATRCIACRRRTQSSAIRATTSSRWRPMVRRVRRRTICRRRSRDHARDDAGSRQVGGVDNYVPFSLTFHGWATAVILPFRPRSADKAPKGLIQWARTPHLKSSSAAPASPSSLAPNRSLNYGRRSARLERRALAVPPHRHGAYGRPRIGHPRRRLRRRFLVESFRTNWPTSFGIRRNAGPIQAVEQAGGRRRWRRRRRRSATDSQRANPVAPWVPSVQPRQSPSWY